MGLSSSGLLLAAFDVPTEALDGRAVFEALRARQRTLGLRDDEAGEHAS